MTSDKVKRFRLEDFVLDNEYFHIARVNISSRQDLSLHTHDYAEVLWIEKGSGIHHINGNDIRIKQCDLIMIRPGDTHSFSSRTGNLTLLNVAFPVETLNLYHDRYFSQSHTMFWTEDSMPYHIRMPQDTISRLSSMAEETMRHARLPIFLDTLMLTVFRYTMEKDTPAKVERIPQWLQNAITQYNSPAMFGKGTKEFASLCNKNTDYANRAVRKYFNKTLTSLLNEMKMKYAATQLTMTNMPIKEICQQCGFDNLGHFYSLFKETYSQTPAEYRNHNQKIV